VVRPDACSTELTQRAQGLLCWRSYALNRVFERDAFWVVFRKPFFGGIFGRKDLQMIAVATCLLVST
jgi:hypothetical protein